VSAARAEDDTVEGLVASLRVAGVDDVDGTRLARALYATDASLYRVLPQVVVRPRHRDEIAATLEVARTAGVALTARGAGTSIAGNAVGPGIVLDCARHLDAVLDLDAEGGVARVEPGVVHASLQRRALAHGRRFGPDPSTHTRCTVGGMIGNNACGSRALGYGRTADNVEALTVLLGTGETVSVGATPGTSAAEAALVALADAHLAHVRTHFGRFSRQVSGYSLEHLLPEHGRRVDRFLVGSEGTLGLVLDATVRLVADPPERLLVTLGYPSMVDAADAVPALLPWEPVACEGLDSRLVDVVAAAGRPVPELPRGAGWLLVEVTGDTAAACAAAAERVVAAGGALAHRMVPDPGEAAALWRLREDGAGLAARSLERPAYSGWEDAAVPPDRLGEWLRRFEELLAGHGLATVPYGHFGDGCVHARIDFPLDAADGPSRLRAFAAEAARALRDYAGSLSGEHGDGRARSELLPLMYDGESLRLFAAAKAICDPDGVLNPGVLVDPAPLDGDVWPARPRSEPVTVLRLAEDRGSLADAVHRCTGVGSCLVTQPGSVAVMCPSYLATREQKDSTRGRARVLQEALDGTLVRGLGDPVVHEALDLCLACKGCRRDCPTGVDMATYKAEVLAQRYAHARRPRSHRMLGALPLWLRLSAPVSPVANALMRLPGAAGLAKAAAGVHPDRGLPRPARRTLRAQATRTSSRSEPPDVWIWADTFTDHLRPAPALAAIEVLASAGLTARVLPESACCGLTWFGTGQLDRARAVAGRTVARLAPYLEDGTPLLGLEPSCLASLRSDLAELTDDPRAAAVREAAVSLAELLTSHDFTPPDLTGVTVVAQPHCHHASVLGWEADEALLRRGGAEVVRVSGCCGLAGSFGMEREHYEVSVAVAETRLLPAVREHPDAVVLADGLSCHHQLADLAGVPSQALAELLAGKLTR
jgi:FAD/FMN-containing dehydrogenase/Fe-S oxidoreductase